MTNGHEWPHDGSLQGDVIAPDNPRSKLSLVREQLLGNPQVYFAGEISIAKGLGGWTETVNMIIAPTTPMADVDRLNAFMEALGTDIHTGGIASLEKGGGIHLGYLEFDETIGTAHRVIEEVVESTEPEVLRRAGIRIGASTTQQDQEFKRRSWIRVYPTAELASIMFAYEQGLQDGTVELNDDIGFQKYSIRPEIVAQIRSQQPNGLFARLRRV